MKWIKTSLEDIEFKTVLDGFSGTGAISYVFKEMGKEVHSNDILLSNYIINKSLISNIGLEHITENDIFNVISYKKEFKYKTFIEDTFHDIYYLDEENKWLDIVVQNILNLKNENKKNMFLWALFQSCISKRPYNLFHRKNLNIRTKEVKRSFGNKTTWDKPFEEHFRKFINEINKAVFNNGKNNQCYCKDIFDLDVKTDLVYFDTPYIPIKGSITTYSDFYHFLDGMSDYYNWKDKIDYNTKNKKIKSSYSIWEDKKNIKNGFVKLIEKFNDRKIVISYREDGIPSINEIKQILIDSGKDVIIKKIDYKYVLSKKQNLKEVLIMGI